MESQAYLSHLLRVGTELTYSSKATVRRHLQSKLTPFEWGES